MKVKLSKVNVLALFALPVMGLQAQNYGDYGPAPKQVVHRVNSHMSHGSVINLKRAFARKLRAGEKIKSIRIITSNNSYNSKAVLKKYGQRLDSVSLDGYSHSKTLHIPRGTSLQDLKLVVKGSVYLQRIVAQVKKSYGGGGYDGGYDGGYGNDVQTIKAQIVKHTYGVTKIPVKQAIKNQTGIQLSGLKVKKVILRAKETGGYWSNGATVQLMINGRTVGAKKYLSRHMERIVIPLSSYQRNIIGEDIRTIKLKVVGDALVKMVGLKVDDLNQGGGYDDPYGPEVVTVRVQKSLQGHQRLTLAQLLGYSHNVNMNKTIAKVEIVTRGQGVISLAGAGYGRRPQAPGVGNRQQGAAIFELDDNATTARDLALETSGSLTIKKIIITFNY